MNAAQCRAARGLLGWTQDRLAETAEVNPATVRGFERGIKQPQRASLAAIRRALETAGVEFLDASGVRLARNMPDGAADGAAVPVAQ